MHLADQLDDERDLTTVAGLAQELEDQAALLIAVATAGPRIETVQAEYQQRRLRLVRALRRRGLDYPFPWHDLWRWYGFWGSLGGYAPRRAHIRDLLGSVLDALAEQDAGLVVADPGSDSEASWTELDARLAGLTVEMSRASTRDDLQDVGRRAREVLIACARLLADPALVPSGSPEPKAGDAKAWLDLFLKVNAGGPARGELRRLVRDAWDLAQKVTHGDVQAIDAFAAAQATVLVVRTLQELALATRTSPSHPSR